MSTEQQIQALNELIESRRHTFPITYAEIKACGPAAMQEWKQRLIARANEMYGEHS